MADPQSCGQCECCEAWRADRDRLIRERDKSNTIAGDAKAQIERLVGVIVEIRRLLGIPENERLLQQVRGVVVERDAAIAERDRWIAEHNAVVARLAQTVTDTTQRFVTEIARLRALLRELEWADGTEDGHCAVCHHRVPHQHTPDCRLKAALEGEA